VIDQNRRLLLSLKPRYAEAILSGEKTVELRRTRPRVAIPTEALIYASSPNMALVGRCRVDAVRSMTTEALWRRFGKEAAVTRDEFRSYFDGAKLGFALILVEPERLLTPVPLAEIRTCWSGFQPPQSFRYLSIPRSEELLAMAG
jgi:predicted transcriptional regulator